jgi:quinol monooxygenase YgiN
MIHVIATIQVVPGKRDEFLEVFSANVPNVLAEDGCIRYEPTVDVDSGLGIQGELRGNAVTIVETWESLEALHRHLAAPHMATYREKSQHLVTGTSLQVLESV